MLTNKTITFIINNCKALETTTNKLKKELIQMTNKYTVEQLAEMMQEVNSWDGSLEEFEYYEMEQINDLFHGVEPLEILRMAHFGNFEWQDEMFKINGLGNLDSCSEDYFITELTDNEDEIVGRYNELVEDGDIEPIE